MQTGHRYGRAGHGVGGFALGNLRGEGVVAAGFEGSLYWSAHHCGCHGRSGAYLVVDALVEEHTERPPIDLT